ncbi:MAG: hypothetical protein IT580_15660 [Verrucomicrobiales bacterium]|nr:hypothetical protein [Verrucomicrobiales bacterium]
MKGNSLLVGLAFILAALSVGVTYQAYEYVQLSRLQNRAQFTITQVELRQNRLRAMVSEAMDYAKQNPAIAPILQSIGAPPQALPPAAKAPTP